MGADNITQEQNRYARAELRFVPPMLATVKQAGFTKESFDKCLSDDKLKKGVESVRDRASKEFGVDSTPTFFINGKKYTGAMSFEDMQKLIDPLVKA